MGVVGLLVLLSAGSAAAEDVVQLGNLKFVHYGAVSYMKTLCPKYGVRVEEHVFAKGPDIMPAMVGGDIELAALAADGAISARANGVPIYVVAGFAKGGARLVARAGSGITKLAQLKGKKVGVTRGGAHELLLYAELDKAGLKWSDKPGADVQVVFLAYADLNQALLGKQIDAMCQSEPHSSQAISKQIGVELLKPYDTPLGEPHRLLVMSEKLYANKARALRVLTCFVAATRAFQQDAKLAEKYVREQMFKGQLSAQDYSDAMSNAAFTYDVTAEHIETTTSLMQKYGVGKMAKKPVVSDWVKLDLLQKVKSELGAP
ncbi:MAG: ABC-type nitrate/sulfonate/bicarbonate transport system, periplasmic component [Myxococcaceae bacterium]|nr:ABC-type nitrate/sulfonate/bicarbonate transport system, periplasmic component [Myxococcaceae bacterium]